MESPIRKAIKALTETQRTKIITSWGKRNVGQLFTKRNADKDAYLPVVIKVEKVFLDAKIGWCVMFQDTSRVTAFTQYKPFELFLVEFKKCSDS